MIQIDSAICNFYLEKGATNCIRVFRFWMGWGRCLKVISDGVGDRLSEVSSLQRPGSKDPHWQNFSIGIDICIDIDILSLRNKTLGIRLKWKI